MSGVKPHETVQFRYGNDNLGYLLRGRKGAIAVDGGAVDDMLAYLEREGLTLEMVTNTHSHGDHTCGNQALLEASGARFIPVSELPGAGHLTLEGQRIKVISTPGHTEDSVCFSYRNVLLTGDTLFNGKIGRCFTGDTRAFFHSISRLMGFPHGTFIYAGHDYLLEYLDKAEELDPENRLIEVYRDGYDPGKVLVSTLGWEKQVDPFLRFNHPSMVALLKGKGLAAETEYERFASMLTLM